MKTGSGEPEHISVLMSAAVETSQVATVLANREFTITHVNPRTVELARRLEPHSRIRADQLVGAGLDVLYCLPDQQRALLVDPACPTQAVRLARGPEVLELRIEPVFADGVFAGLVLTWDLVTERNAVEARKNELSRQLHSTSQKLADSSGILALTNGDVADSASRTSSGARKAMENAQHISARVAAVASTAEAMRTNIARLADHSAQTARVVAQAHELAAAAKASAAGVAQDFATVGQVTRLIGNVAHRTKLLALNATLEAEKAGTAGKGFVVVAGEVKALARETAESAEAIRVRLLAMSAESTRADRAMCSLVEAVARVGAFADSLATAVEEHVAVVRQIAEQSAEASSVAEGAASTIDGVARLAGRSAAGTEQSQTTIRSLSELARVLREALHRSAALDAGR